jgi:CubicO group peptidase (beta-lactamase class C family)
VLEPLGLDATFVGAPQGTDRAMAQGHRANLRPTGPWRMGAYAPSGGMVSNLSDMVRFLEAVMEAEGGPLAGTVPGAGSSTPGPGWMLQEEGDRRAIRHDGRTGGSYAFVGFDPDASRGLVVLSNSSHDGNDFSLGLPRHEPQVRPIRVGGLPLAFTVALLTFSPLTVLGTSARGDDTAEAGAERRGRLHLLDGALTGPLFLVFAWKVGAW